MKNFAIVVTMFAALLSGCATSSGQSDKYAELIQQNHMIEREQSHFDLVLERAHQRPIGVQKIFIADLGLDKVEIDEVFHQHNRLRDDWTLTDKDKLALQNMFSDASAVYFVEKNGFELVAEPELADVIVTADLTRIAPSAPKDDARSRDIGVKYFTEGSGSMTVEIEVYKDETLVMKIEDDRDAGKFWERNTKSKNAYNTRVLFKKWMRHLSELI